MTLEPQAHTETAVNSQSTPGNGQGLDLSQDDFDDIFDSAEAAQRRFKVPEAKPLTGLVPGSPEFIGAPPESATDPGAIESHLYDLTGFLGDFNAEVAACSRYPNAPLATAGALAVMSHLTGRKVQSPSGLRTNLYIASLGPPSVGKDAPRKRGLAVLESAGLGGSVLGRIGSGEGLQDALKENPAQLVLADEIAHLLASIKNDTSGSRQTIASELLELYTSSDTGYRTRRLAGREGGAERIDQPHVTLHGTATTAGFYGALSTSMANDGLVARLLVIEAAPRGQRQMPEIISPSSKLVEFAKYWAGLEGGTPQTMQYDQKSHAVFEDADDAFDDEWTRAKGDVAGCAIWGRAGALAVKLAMLHTLSRNRESLTIDADAAWWAYEFAFLHARRLVYRTNADISENPFDARCKRLLRLVDESPEIQHGDALRRLNCTAREMKDTVEVLVERGQLRIETRGRGKWYMTP